MKVLVAFQALGKPALPLPPGRELSNKSSLIPETVCDSVAYHPRNSDYPRRDQDLHRSRIQSKRQPGKWKIPHPHVSESELLGEPRLSGHLMGWAVGSV